MAAARGTAHTAPERPLTALLALVCMELPRSSGQFQEARLDIFQFIEGWYNPHRRHKGIGQPSMASGLRLDFDRVDRGFRLRRVVLLVAGSLAAGAAGCFFLQWSQGRETEYVGTLVAFLAIAVTVFGWYKTTGLQATEQEKLHELQVAAQREFILLKLLNEARHEIRQVLMQEADRLGACSMDLYVLRFSDPVTPELRADVARTLREATTHRSATDWIFVLRRTRRCFPRCDLLVCSSFSARIKCTTSFAGTRIFWRLPDPCLGSSMRQQRTFLGNNISDQSALLGDLRIHVQSRALDPVSGHATPERQPPDDRVPRLIMDDGNLVISVPDAARRVQMEGANWLPPRNPPGAYSP